MKHVNTNQIKAIPDTRDTEYSAVRFETMDGEPAYLLGWTYDNARQFPHITPRFFTAEDGDETETDRIRPKNSDTPIIVYRFLDGMYAEDQADWEESVNDRLKSFRLKLGAHHPWTRDEGEYHTLTETN